MLRGTAPATTMDSMKRTLFSTISRLARNLSKRTMLSNCSTLVLAAVLLVFLPRASAQNGTVIAWGDNRFGQTNVPPGLNNVVAIAVGEWHNLALKADGTLVAWGVNNAGQRDIPPDVTNVVAIAAGGYHNLAVKADGTVRAWGQNDNGQCNVPPSLTNVVAVSGGWTHSVALKADGTVVAWGRDYEGQSNVPYGLNNVVAISASEYHNFALRANGTIVAWGWNGLGQTTIPETLSNNVVAAVATGLHSLALTSDGKVTAWGWDQFGQTAVPADLDNVIAISGGGEHSLALKADGTVVAWGQNEAWTYNDPNCAIIGHPCERSYAGQIDVPPGLSNVVAIAGGNFHTVVLCATNAPPPPMRISNILRLQNQFQCTAPTRRGKIYALEYKNSLTDPGWNIARLVRGTGEEEIFNDSTTDIAERYYRVREWQE